jgi:coenzyme F420-reducing hydrogenase delta subunit
MKVQELMERVGSQETGRMIAYIKDGLEEINMISETHVDTITIDITEDQRFYKFPNDMVKILDIRCKNHRNTNDAYQSIPRSIYKPEIEDADGN